MGERLDAQEDLVNYFERVTGHAIRSRADLDRYLDYAQDVRPQWLHVNRVPTGSAFFKQIVLALLLVIAVVQYVALDALVEIASLPGTTYFVSGRS